MTDLEDESNDDGESGDFFDFITADTELGDEFAEALREDTEYIEIDGEEIEVDDE